MSSSPATSPYSRRRRESRGRERGFLLFALLVVLAGCQTGTLADPNDPREAGILTPDVIRRQLKGTSDMLMERVAKGELSDPEFKELIAKRANELLQDLPMDKIEPDKAWEYGDVFRTAKRWQQAELALKVAVDYATKTNDEDRRVNDTLRLAQAEAMLGKVPQALKDAESVMNTPPGGSAPILPAVLLELVPAAEGKGHDAELAKLLEQAVGKHMNTQVDLNTEGGKLFILARPHHVRNAWRKIAQLYAKAKQDTEARAAIQRGEEMMRSMRRV